jgi:hypothetical protein
MSDQEAATLEEVDAELARLPATPTTRADILARASLMRRRIELVNGARVEPNPITDERIAAYGLDVQIDDLIRTCGFGRVQAALQGAPGRFAARRERMQGAPPRGGPGAPKKRDERFYRALFDAVDGVKHRDGLDDDKEACHRFFAELAAFKRGLVREGKPDVLLGLDEIAKLKRDSLVREWKRAKSRFWQLSRGQK